MAMPAICWFIASARYLHHPPALAIVAVRGGARADGAALQPVLGVVRIRVAALLILIAGGIIVRADSQIQVVVVVKETLLVG